MNLSGCSGGSCWTIQGEQDVQLRCIRLDSSGHGGVDDLIRHGMPVLFSEAGRGSTLVSIEHRGLSARIAD
jgi:hypothetical protein